MMRKLRSRNVILTLWMLGLLMIGYGITMVSASPSYQLTLMKGTEEYTIVHYDEAAWDTTVNPSTSPNEFFEGDADIIGAKSKQTVKGWVDTTYSTYDALLSLYFSIFEFGAWYIFLNNFTAAGYNETSINENYPNTYSLWSGISSEWWFTEGAYPETPNNTMSPIIIMKDPLDYKLILDDCNTILEEIRNDPAIDISIKLAFSLQNKTADEFAWQLVTYGFGVASPSGPYLEEMVSELGCVKTSVRYDVNFQQDSTLIFNKTGVTDYSIEVTYGSKGILSTFVVKDASEEVIYKIISSNTEWLFYTLLFSFIGISAAVITYVIVRKLKLRK